MGTTYDRCAGILLHISSLPGPYGVGDMGPAAVEFADFLADAGCRAWQMLPLSPTAPAFGFSPYSSPSACAGNTLFISPEGLAELGLLSPGELAGFEPPGWGAPLERVFEFKARVLLMAYENFRGGDKFSALSGEFWDFCAQNADWLDDHALFAVLKETAGDVSWTEWQPAYASRDLSVLESFKHEAEVARKLDLRRFEQFIFFKQMAKLRESCAERGIELIGDLPIYVAHDSADVWGNREFFELGEDGLPTVVSGVPPDYFSPTGQRWGNPLYRWEYMRGDGYAWWIKRFRQALLCADRVRVDHFRGFFGYWEILASEKDAVSGVWKPGPGKDFLAALRGVFARDGVLPFIAEDLGVITDDVRDGMAEFGLPGMRVLHFAFSGGADNPNTVYMHPRECVAYTGTHDNNTTLGWWRNADIEERANFRAYIGYDADENNVASAMMRLAYASAAELAIIPMQDVLGLGEEARMNQPSTSAGNWTWRMSGDERLDEASRALRDFGVIYGRFAEKPEKRNETRI